MIDEKLSSVQPLEAPFTAHNAKVQEFLRGTTVANTVTNNWWRTESGHISVMNCVDGRQLRREAAKQPLWNDWKVTRGSVVVDVAEIVRERKRRNAVLGVVVLALLWLVYAFVL